MLIILPKSKKKDSEKDKEAKLNKKLLAQPEVAKAVKKMSRAQQKREEQIKVDE